MMEAIDMDIKLEISQTNSYITFVYVKGVKGNENIIYTLH